MKKKIIQKKIFISAKISLVFIGLILVSFSGVYAEMSSTNYKIKTDSLNFGGSDYGASTNYRLTDTAGEEGVGISYSTNYRDYAGYRQMLVAEPTFSFTLSANTCALGALSTGSVSSCNYSVTTTTNAASGYATTLTEDGNLRTAGGADVNDVSDGAVSAGAEEYGVGLTGADRAFADERGILTTPSTLTIASNSGAVSNSSVTVTHKSAINTATAAGSYSHSLTVVSTASF